MADLKSCPFCGSENIGIYAFSVTVDASVRCNDCSASSGEYNADRIDGESHREYEARCAELAAAAWNRRADDG